MDKKSNVHILHIANSDKPVAFYSLDVILAVGYRANSARAINFRNWATNVLKSYLLKGYAINRKRLLQAQERLKELPGAISFLQDKAKHELLGVCARGAWTAFFRGGFEQGMARGEPPPLHSRGVFKE